MRETEVQKQAKFLETLKEEVEQNYKTNTDLFD